MTPRGRALRSLVEAVNCISLGGGRHSSLCRCASHILDAAAQRCCDELDRKLRSAIGDRGYPFSLEDIDRMNTLLECWLADELQSNLDQGDPP